MKSITGRRLATALAITLIVLAFGSVTRAGEMLAGNDEAIKEILRETLPIAAAQFAKFDSDVVRVYHQRSYNAEKDEYTVTENKVWWVGRGEAEELTNYVKDYGSWLEIKDVQAFVIHGGEVTMAAALSGDIEHIDESRIKLQKGDGKSRSTNLVVAFDTAQPGDLIGISITIHISRGLQWSEWSLAGDYPTARCELEIQNSHEIAFAIFGNRFRPGAMQQETIEKVKGHIRHLKLWADDIDAICREPYAPSRELQSPSFSLVWRAERYPWGKKYIWWESRDWNMVAEKRAGRERTYAKKKKNTVKMAKTLADGATGEEAINLLYAFARDEIQDVSSYFYAKDNNKRTVDAILKARAGDDYEKSYLLLQMLLSLGFEAEVIWAHDPDDGSFFVKYPNSGQMDVPLVRVKVNDRVVWLDLACKGCAPGSIDARLSGTTAMSYARDADKKGDKLWERVAGKAQIQEVPTPILYLDFVERENWNRIFQVETGDRVGTALLSEEVVLTRDEKLEFKRRMHVSSSGLSRLFLASNAVGAEDVTEDWIERRFQGSSGDSMVSASSIGAETLEAVFDLDLGPVPDPMGDTWILPPDLVYGEPSVREWPEIRLSAFHVENDNETRWEFRIPLPSGWTDAAVPATQRIGVKCFDYVAHYVIVDGELVVRRVLKEIGCTIDEDSSVALIGRHAKAIRELELTPVVLTRKE